jgi:multicomponent Na+:H+ antiporter subunit F
VTAFAAAIGAGVALVLCLLRLFAGPTLYDRMLAINGVVTKLVVIMAAASVIAGQAALIDAAIAFVLAMVVTNIAALKFFALRTFQRPLARAEDI